MSSYFHKMYSQMQGNSNIDDPTYFLIPIFILSKLTAVLCWGFYFMFPLSWLPWEEKIRGYFRAYNTHILLVAFAPHRDKTNGNSLRMILPRTMLPSCPA